MGFLRNVFGKKTPTATTSSSPTNSPPVATVLPQRLADPKHPARRHIDEIARLVDQQVKVEAAETGSFLHASVGIGENNPMLIKIDEALAVSVSDLDLLVAKACVLFVAGQFKTAEEVVDSVLAKDPNNFEAKSWKNHWRTWLNAFRVPSWSEQQTSLHPVMASQLRSGLALQVVRDGLQKTLAIVTGIQGPPLNKQTRIQAEWILSQTPSGPLIAYYVNVVEPGQKPNVMEAFLPVFEPKESPLEGYFLIQQLAFTPYCYVVLVSGNQLALNRKLVFGPKTTQKVRDIAARLTSTRSYLPQSQFQSAAQWHMNHFDMDSVKFE
jgi:hypothetical protein